MSIFQRISITLSLPKLFFSWQKHDTVGNDVFQTLKKGSDSEEMAKLNEDFW